MPIFHFPEEFYAGVQLYCIESGEQEVYTPISGSLLMQCVVLYFQLLVACVQLCINYMTLYMYTYTCRLAWNCCGAAGIKSLLDTPWHTMS